MMKKVITTFTKAGFLILLLVTLYLGGCKKFLDEKSDKKLSTPEKLSDLNGMMDFYSQINARYPQAGEINSDNYFLTDASWATASELHRNYYTWQKYDRTPIDWTPSYESIFMCNVVLETLPKIEYPVAQEAQAAYIRGNALFLRGYFYLALAQLFAPVYDEQSSATDLGLPLRLNAEINEISVRSTVKDTYNQIIKDLTESIPLLPALPFAKHRASKAAAYGTLARTYLFMQKYQLAGLYADSCLKLISPLMDYNTISTTSTIPFKQFNDEVVFDTRTSAPSALLQTRAKVLESLYQSYQQNDLRKNIFYKLNSDGSKAFKGNYTGLSTAVMFTGIATDEMLLTRAECYARMGEKEPALSDLNKLLINRFKTGSFVAVSTPDAAEALKIILEERRKELVFRTLRWSDLRRLNKEPGFSQNLSRTINGKSYELKPGSLRYTLQIDAEAILLSGMQQNP